MTQKTNFHTIYLALAEGKNPYSHMIYMALWACFEPVKRFWGCKMRYENIFEKRAALMCIRCCTVILLFVLFSNRIISLATITESAATAVAESAMVTAATMAARN